METCTLFLLNPCPKCWMWFIIERSIWVRFNLKLMTKLFILETNFFKFSKLWTVLCFSQQKQLGIYYLVLYRLKFLIWPTICRFWKILLECSYVWKEYSPWIYFMFLGAGFWWIGQGIWFIAYVCCVDYVKSALKRCV